VRRSVKILPVVYLAKLFAGGPAQLPASNAHALKPGGERSIQAQPAEIRRGRPVLLSWFNPHTTEVLVEEASGITGRGTLRTIGRYPSQGSIEVRPAETTMYVISCAGPSSKCAESICVMVRE
jgi:hypothetical protein